MPLSFRRPGKRRSSVNVLSTPTILTSDNKEAEIFVGQNVPFVTATNLSSTGLSQQSVDRKDIGINLKITPQISEGEYVKLDIYQEISAITANKGQATDPGRRQRYRRKDLGSRQGQGHRGDRRADPGSGHRDE